VSTLEHSKLDPVEIDPSDGFTPEEVGLLAVVSNPSLQSARDTRGIAAAQVVAAGLLPNPTLNVSAYIPSAGKTAGNRVGYSAQLAWSLEQLFIRGPQEAAADFAAQGVELDIVWAEWKIALVAQLLAHQILILQDAQGVHDKNISELQEVRLRIQHATSQGTVLGSHLVSTEAVLGQAQAASAMNRRDTAVLQAQLQGLLGGMPDVVSHLTEPSSAPERDTPSSAAKLFEQLEQRRPDLRALRLGIQSRDASYQAASRRAFPAIQLALQVAQDPGDFIAIGPSLQVGLPFLSRGQGERMAAKAEAKQIGSFYMERLNQARERISVAIVQVEGAQATLEILGTAIERQEKLVAFYDHAKTRGEVDILVYYAARSTLIDLRLQQIRERLGLQEARFALFSESGTLHVFSP